MDDLQLLQEDTQWQALCALIRDGADRRFLLLSRGAPPACLRAFQYTGLMTVLDADALTFDREDVLCRIDLHTGDLTAADAWYRTRAPQDPLHLNVMKRYQYLTQAMTELALGQPDAALLTLSPLRPYCEVCARHIDGIHLDVLCAVALYRKRDGAWRDRLSAALAAAESYRFIRTVSGYGAAVLPLLEEWDGGGSRWFKRVMNDVRVQAAYYPLFLQPPPRRSMEKPSGPSLR